MLQTPHTSKWMRAGFYALIGYTAISTTLAWTTQLGIIQVDRQVDANQAVEKEAEGDESESSARAFAANVAREYLHWNQGQEDSRRERLEPYLHPDLDAQAGLDLKNVEWNSWAREVEVWEISKKDNEFIAWVYAQTTMSKGKKQKRVDRWIKIPMEKAGASYLVTDTPYFTAPPEAELPKEKDDEKEWGERADREIRADVEKFLNSFWKTYTTGNPEEIGYMLQGDQTAKGLTGIASFIEMDHLEVIENKGNFLAQVDVRFRDLASQAEVTYPYSLYLSREGNRWYVVRIEINH